MATSTETKRYRCKYEGCSKSFDVYSSYYTHLYKHKPPKLRKCKACDYTNASKYKVLKHYWDDHEQKEQPQREHKKEQQVEEEEEEDHRAVIVKSNNKLLPVSPTLPKSHRSLLNDVPWFLQ